MRSRLPRVVLSVVNTLCAEFRFHEGLGSFDRVAGLLQTSHTQEDAAHDTAEESSSVLPTSIIMNSHNTEAKLQKPETMALPVDVADERSDSDFPISQQPEEVEPMVSVPQPSETTGAESGGLTNFPGDSVWDFLFEGGSFLRYHDSR